MNVDARFASSSAGTSASEAALKSSISGLVSAAEFKKATALATAASAAQQLQSAGRPGGSAAAAATASLAGAAGSGAGGAAKRSRAPVLSFAGQEDEEGGEVEGGDGGTGGAAVAAAAKRVRVGKDPTADTAFLPDASRDSAEAAAAERARADFAAQHEAARRERIEITYSWWDGTGHRRTITVPKGASVGRFLQWVVEDLADEFPALRGTGGDALLYIKEDIIMPANVTFLELIAARARGKSGPLFNFGVHEDLRLIDDTRVAKDSSHPGKVIERRWYEKNKHTFPASLWEAFSWAKAKGDEPYTAKDTSGSK